MLARAFDGYPNVIVAVDMNICRLMVRPADAKIKSKTEETIKHKTQNRKGDSSEGNGRSGTGSLKVLKSLYLGA